MKRIWGTAMVTVLVLAGAACGDDDDDANTRPVETTAASATPTTASGPTTTAGGPDPCTTPATGTVSEAELDAELEGNEEVPGPGARDADGSFEGTFDTTRGAITYELDVEGTDAPTAAHIHEGAMGVAGPPVVTLQAPPANGKTEACVRVDPALAARIAANPAGFYVNIHTGQFPDGAVRGQLDT